MNTSAFHPTRWTLVLRSRGDGAEAQSALSELCAAYYAPVVAFLRRDGRGDDVAREKAHAFFASVLASGVGAPDRERGRFRNYLLGALKHFLSKHRDAALAEKRGAGAEHVSLTSAGASMPAAPDDALAFDREWAHTLIARALAALEAEKPTHFPTLKPWLDGGADCSQADAARTLGMNKTAVKVAIHRLRQRFREIIRAEVADELRHLIAIAGRG